MDDMPTWHHNTPSGPGREGGPPPPWPPRMHNNDDGDPTTHHPPPASQATARGVVGGWNDAQGQEMRGRGQRGGDDDGGHYHLHRCEHLLAGWMGDGGEMRGR